MNRLLVANLYRSTPTLHLHIIFLTGTGDCDFSIIISPRDTASVHPQLLLRDVREGEGAGGLLEKGGGVHMCPHVGEASAGVVGGCTVEGEVVTQQH